MKWRRENINKYNSRMNIREKFLDAPWYFETFFQKLLFIIMSASLVYSIARIIAQGFW